MVNRSDRLKRLGQGLLQIRVEAQRVTAPWSAMDGLVVPCSSRWAGERLSSSQDKTVFEPVVYCRLCVLLTWGLILER